jgi:hypothetical protein
MAVEPRRSGGARLPLCAEHLHQLQRRVEEAYEETLAWADPNMTPSNRAAAGEDLGDAEE